MDKIILIGAGQLGSRHLQALCLRSKTSQIYIIDPVQGSLEIAKSRIEQVSGSKNHGFFFLTNLTELKERYFDLAIISTSSDVRFEIFTDLIKKVTIKSIIFEKVLFQKLCHYDKVGKLLINLGIKAWVNCPRRCFWFYRHVKANFIKQGLPIHVVYRAKENFGIGCNAIHIIDIVNYISGEYVQNIDTSGLHKNLLASKRDNFIEFAGTLECLFEGNSHLTIHANEDVDVKSVIEITQGNTKITYNEQTGDYSIFQNNELLEQSNSAVLFQSELTNEIADEILEAGECALPSFFVSTKLHKILIKKLLKFQNAVSGFNEDKVRIT